MNDLPISKTVSIKEAGYNEEWLQNLIWENPNYLGLGELESITRETVVSSGGRLDILLKNPDTDAMYEVEVMLGETDPSHIIRTIEYWDLIRKKWPQRQHFGVLIAEKITKRYFNVIQLLSNNVPLMAIQVNIIENGDNRSVHFTTILDIYEEPEEDTIGIPENIDEQFWIEKSSAVLNTAKKIYKITKDIYDETTLNFNKTRITFSSHGYNQMYFRKGSENSIIIIFRYGSKKEEIEELLHNNDITFTDDSKRIKFQLYERQIENKLDIFPGIAKLNNNWWRD